MRSLLFVLFILVSPWTWAESPTPEYLAILMEDARDPIFKTEKKKEVLTIASHKISEALAQELGVKPSELKELFRQNPKKMDILKDEGWQRALTQFYVSLHLESFRYTWEKNPKLKKVSDYGQNIYAGILTHLGKYSPARENLIYSRWSKSANYTQPFFLVDSNIDNLIKIEAHTPYEKLFPTVNSEGPINPSLETFLKNVSRVSRSDYQELAEKIQLNLRAYLRTVANSAKTIASIHYLTGEFSFSETEDKVEIFINNFCQGCSDSDKISFKSQALSYISNMKKEFSQQYRGADDVVEGLCTDLKNNHYQFEEIMPAYVPGPNDIQSDSTSVDRSGIKAQAIVNNMRILQRSVHSHDLGVLFLTDALMELTSSQVIVGTRLGCSDESRSNDRNLVKKAIKEAKLNVETHLTQVNQNMSISRFSLKAATETLEYFTQTNVSAMAEAMVAFPQGIPLISETILKLDQDIKRRKRVDKIVCWGGMVVGVAISATGIGAPEGVTILLTLAAITNSLVSASYNYARSKQEEAFVKELAIAAKGLGNQFYLDQNMSNHYEQYRLLRLYYQIDFASSLVNFIKLHRLAFIMAKGNEVVAQKGLWTLLGRTKGTSITFEELKLALATLF